MTPYAAVLADVDDTIIDSGPVQWWAWTTWAQRHGLDPDPFISGHGMRIEDKLREYAPHLVPAQETAHLVELAAACPLAATAFPGAARLLATTPKLALVTSGLRRIVERHLTTAGLEPPEVMVTAEDVSEGKPAPEPFLTAARRLGVQPAQCVVLEDAPAGVRAGVAAGMTVVAVTTTTKADTLWRAGARFVIPDVETFVRERERAALGL